MFELVRIKTSNARFFELDKKSRWQLLRLISFIEIIVITVGFFLIVWLVGPNLRHNGLGPVLTTVLAFSLLYISYLSPVLIHRDPSEQRGLGGWNTLFVRTDNIYTDFRPYLWITVAGCTIVIAIALMNDQEVFSKVVWQAFFLKLALYIFNAIGQGMLFLSFLLTRLRVIVPISPEITKPGQLGYRHQFVVCSTCALLFCFFHIPNLPLMFVTLVMGFTVSWIFYKTPNLLLAAVAHAIVGTVLHQIMQLHMRIGPFYWESDKYVFRTLFPVLKEIIGDLY